MKSILQLSFWGLLFCFSANARAENMPVAESDTTALRTLIVVFDGLRPDYIKPEWMPHLYAFSKKAAYAKDNHSVFPTVTRVNAASYATGSYPQEHGLMGNTIYLPAVNSQKSLSTGDAGNLRHIMDTTSGKLLTAPSLGEVLRAAGERMFVYSSGTTGQAFLQNHTVNGAIINPDLILPESFKAEIAASIGSPPEGATPNTARHQWITDALCRYTLAAGGPLVSAIWFSDPDGTAHEHGIGVPITLGALKAVDAQFGRILDTIRARGLEPVFNIIITADHGFVTHTGKQGFSGFLIQKGLKESKDSDDIILADGALYVKDHNPVLIKKTVEALQEQEWVGAIFTKAAKPGSMKGIIKGTLSFESIHWNHPHRAADILVTENWNNNKNSLGYAGTDFAGGVAGHGGSSFWEIHIPLIAYGPSFKSALESNLPTSNIDIVPTILHIHHIAAPAQMQGRIMYELLQHNTIKPMTPKKETILAETKLKQGKYQLMLERTVLGKYRYINYVSVTRVR
ncbi:alkaline phosphatase family protein [Agriterribacter sp.]|uniref:alkaline phosphatase family protein n=1 Tax=Agriterribacter sp. TaxID=2821509 RepID=UPI002B9B4E16|nr:alkaline phosphatase family protein [Agriterribacter sp.]HRO47729.1 alkaline phosphatase family protein [Agriterribacter sp.]HRQ17208.1 alkaline phosphatase family protein [Agriterribacter sp.]